MLFLPPPPPHFRLSSGQPPTFPLPRIPPGMSPFLRSTLAAQQKWRAILRQSGAGRGTCDPPSVFSK